MKQTLKQILSQLNFSKELNLIFLSVFLFACAMGINIVTFPTVLAKNHVSSLQIGLASTCDILAGILMSFFLSKLVAKLGLMRTLFIFSTLYTIAISLIYFYHGFYLWLGFCFIMGSSWFAYVITRQAWLNSLLTDSQRGVALGIFSMTISAGIAVGPVIVNFSGAENYLSFLISALLAALSFKSLSSIKSSSKPQVESRRIILKDFFKHNPRCFLARFFLDFQSYFLIIFTVVFGKKIGFTPEKSGLLISAYMASGFFDVFVGFLLKKYNPYKLINIGFLGCLICFLIVSIFYKSYLSLVIVYFFFGMFIACIYVSVFTIANADYKQEKLVAANATFQSIGSIGSLFGGLVGGCLMSLFGAAGFTVTIILSCVCYLSFLVIYEKKYSV